MPVSSHQPISRTSTQPFQRNNWNDYCDPFGCGLLQVGLYDKHRFATFPLEERSRFKDEEINVEPWILAQAGFYYARNDMINCSGCPISIHSNEFLSHVNRLSQTPDIIHSWHRTNYADDCKFALGYVGFHWSREDCRLASLLSAKWRNHTLWQKMNVLDLAKSGFYSENQLNNAREDEVVCFRCNTVVHDWENDDTPDEEHLRLFPECPYLNAKLTTGRRNVEGNIPIDTVDPLTNNDVGTGSNIESDSVETDSCLYPVCSDKSYRERSFPATWPHSSHLSPAVMAAAGFFYVNNLKDDGDRVACYKCGVAAESWIEGDDPVEFHTRVNPICNFLM